MHKIDMNTWPRAELFRFFSGVSQPFYSVTFRVDVTNLHAYTKARGISFYYALGYLVTDAVNAFPSGDAFIVYPAKDGTALDSLRGRVFFQAMQDMRAFQLLESLAGREVVKALIHEDVEGELTFAKYPEAASYLLNLREKVNAELMRFVEA